MKKTILIFSLIFLGFLPFVVGAQNSTTLENPFKGGVDSLPKFVEVLAEDIVLPIGTVVVVLFIIYSGFLFVTAQGNPTKLETAKSAFLYACIGAVVLLGAFVIAQVIQGTVDKIKN